MIVQPVKVEQRQQNWHIRALLLSPVNRKFLSVGESSAYSDRLGNSSTTVVKESWRARCKIPTHPGKIAISQRNYLSN